MVCATLCTSAPGTHAPSEFPMIRRLLPLFAVLFLCAVAESASAATTYYVSPSGFDTNPGTSTQPFLTIQKAANVVLAGDLVIVRPGTYVGAKFTRSGTSIAPIVFRGEPGAIVNAPGPQNTNNDNLWIRDASWITLTGFECHSAGRSGIAVQAEPDAESHGVVISNNYCHNNGVWGIFTAYAEGLTITGNETSFSGAEHGIYVSNSSDNVVIRRNRVHHNSNSGIQINADPALPGDGIISNADVSYNVIWENGTGGAAGINLASVIQSKFTNNLLYNNHASGIAAWDDGFDPAFGTHDNQFLHNTVIQASNGRFAFSLLNGSINNTIRNNVLIHPGTRGSISCDPSSEPGLVSDNNVIVDRFEYNETFITAAQWKARGHDAASVISNIAATVVDAAAGNYHPKAGGPCINTGAVLASVTDDLDGKKRPQGTARDIGAYEFRGDDSVGVYVSASSAWFLRNTNAPGGADVVFGFGAPSAAWVPLRGDWNGDGSDTIGLYDSVTGAFFLRNTNAGGGADLVFTFGAGGLGLVPVVGDWNADGLDTVGLFDPANSVFFLRNSNSNGPADVVFGYGPAGAGWKAVVGDWNGDGSDTVGLYSPGTGTFFLRNSNASGGADIVFGYGPAGATALSGDWNADGADSIGVYVPGSGAWFLRNSNSPGGADVIVTYGPPNVVAVPGDWNSL